MLAVFHSDLTRCASPSLSDNETAFAQHALMRTMRAMATWFCDAYASWQKGGVQNANGRLRRSLPRQIDIKKPGGPTKKFRTSSSPPISRPESAWASETPFQAILKELGKDVQIRFGIDPLHLAGQCPVASDDLWPLDTFAC